MAQNRGKKFEEVIRKAFEKIPNVSIDRIPDQTAGYLGARNICDFIVYKKPYLYYIECKSVHGNTLPFSNITETQLNGLLEKSKVPGVIAGILCWWIDLDQTWFIPIWIVDDTKQVQKLKSINIKHPPMQGYWTPVPGKKKRVLFDYDMSTFFEYMEGRLDLINEHL